MMGLDLIKDVLKRNGKVQIGLGIFLLVFGLGLMILFTSGFGDKSDLSTIGEIFLWLLFIFFIGVGAWSIYSGVSLRKSVDNGEHDLVKAISSGDRGFVVWVYEYIKTTNGVPAYSVFAYGLNKKCYRFGVKSQEQSKAIFKALNESFPQAVMGYSPEIANQMQQQFGLKIKN